MVTHALLGAAIGESVVGKRIGRRGMALGAVTALLPDLDVLGHFLLSDAQELAFHRGITHSLLVTALLTFLLAWLAKRRFQAEDVSPARWRMLFGLSLLSHLLLDTLTCYGTGLFEPFSNYRVAFDTIFVVDPFYTLPLLFVFIMVMATYRNATRRSRWNKWGWWFGTAYLAFTCINHMHVQAVMLRAFTAQGLQHESFTVTPTPMNNLLWMGYSRDADGAWLGYYSLLDADSDVQFHRIQRNDTLLAPYRDDPALQALTRLSKGNYVVTEQGGQVYFNDLRFGYAGSWDSLGSDFALRYNFAEGADNHRPLNRSRHAEPASTVFWKLVHRVMGKESHPPGK
ncbi:MAG TPA: metal-dependent hydrolase [Bacteroidia bacterium]|nr:metal-dependent hydrolase [Bacteroidia bacterium]